MIDDAELLRRYAEDQSEPAFAELVQRHVNVVYAAALRRVGGDAHLAEEVAQTVFTTAARKAASLARHPALLGWLHRSTHYAALDVLRDKLRRERQAQAVALETMHAKAQPTGNRGSAVDWAEIRPVIDSLLDQLHERDRSALLLRFFEGHSFSQIGAALRLTEDAARMRVERALDRLRTALGRRGITSTTAALGAALATQAATAAPAGLAGSLAGTALAAVATGTVGNVGAVGALLTIMSTGKTMVGLAALAAAVAVGTAFLTAGRAREADVKLSSAAGSQAAVDARIAELERRVQLESQRVERAEAENARLLRAAATEKTAGAVQPEEPVTTDVALARLKQAHDLVRTGDQAEALKEMIWLFDVALKRRMEAARLSAGVMLFAELAAKYPPARVAMEERRETARQKMLAHEKDLYAVMEYAAIAKQLKEGTAMIAQLEQLPAGDRRRSELAGAAFDDLLESRRYALALEGQSADSMLSLFEATSRRPIVAGETDDTRRKFRESAISRGASGVEVLAGAGQLADARTLAERVLAYDRSESTRALLQQRLARAGQPDLLSSPSR